MTNPFNPKELHEHIKQTIPVLENMLTYYRMMDQQLNTVNEMNKLNPMTWWASALGLDR